MWSSERLITARSGLRSGTPPPSSPLGRTILGRGPSPTTDSEETKIGISGAR